MSLFDVFKQYPLTVTSLTRQGDFCQLGLSYPEGLIWEAGAYARFTLPEEKSSRATERVLTLASTPNEGEISLIFKADSNASPYKKALGESKVGQELTMRYVYVHTKLQELEKPQIFFVSDVGIATLRPLVLTLLKQGKANIEIYHLHQGCLLFDDELTALSQQSNLSYQKFEAEQEVQTALEEAFCRHGEQAVYYLIGVPSHVRSWAKYLKNQGLPRKNIKREAFTGLK